MKEKFIFTVQLFSPIFSRNHISSCLQCVGGGGERERETEGERDGCVCVCVYIYRERERKGMRERGREGGREEE
jgi:hypothetical protein